MPKFVWVAARSTRDLGRHPVPCQPDNEEQGAAFRRRQAARAGPYHALPNAEAEVVVPPHTTAEVIFDVGALTTGFPKIAVEEGAGSIVRLTYAEWYRRISCVVAGLDMLGLKPGDHIVTALTNRHEAATLHWASW